MRQNHRALALLLAVAFIAISARLAPGQMCSISISAAAPAMVTPSAQMPAYEVATIKPWGGTGYGPSLRFYIQQAFGIPNFAGRVIGPDWIDSTRYVIQGKPPEAITTAMQTMTAAERMKENALMMQSLLADRFRMKAHFETRELPVYELVLAKGGSKLVEDSDPTKRLIASGGSKFRAGASPIQTLIALLGCAPDIGGREIVDKTGLTGTYDFNLQWTPLQAAAAAADGGAASSPDATGASLFTALEDQLGLKLVPAKAQTQVVVIDHIEQPSPN